MGVCLGLGFIFLFRLLEDTIKVVSGVATFVGGGVYEPSGFTVLINNLDARNPLHVQNSDNSSSVIIPSKLLGTKNYRIWSGAVKLALQARNKYGFVDGTCLRESYATSDVLTAQWDKCNAMVLT
ncbi:putative LTR copia-type gag-polypeptide [Tanacetum coccineum]